MANSLTNIHKYGPILDETLNGAVHMTWKLQNVLDIDNFLEEVNIKTKEFTDYQPRLNLNKTLTLKEVL